MKKLILVFSFSFFVAFSFAQSEKYVKAMRDKVTAIDTTFNIPGLSGLSATFERIGDAEKTQWLPYYYAALSQVNSGYMLYKNNPKMDGSLAEQLDPISDKAEALLNKAEALTKRNSEIFVVKKMIATLRMLGNPMGRYMQYAPKAKEALETAKEINPENPRVYLLEGQDKFQTPEQFGGSKAEAKKLFEESIKKYDTFKPASELDPNWGRGTVQYFLSQIK